MSCGSCHKSYTVPSFSESTQPVIKGTKSLTVACDCMVVLYSNGVDISSDESACKARINNKLNSDSTLSKS